MAEITQIISDVGQVTEPPNPNVPATYDTLAYPFSTSLKVFGDDVSTTLVGQLNTFGSQANSLRLEVNGWATLASEKADIATTQAGLANTARIAAEASAASVAALAGAFVGTSTTSVSIGIGNKSFNTQGNEQYTPGVFLSIVSDANHTNFMFGDVVSYNATTGDIVINVSVIGGSGTFSDWNLSLTGPQGPQGPAGDPFTGGSLTSALNTAQDTVASSATTSDIWSALGNQIDFTGTATVTAFPNAPQAGAKRELICADACSFTASTNMKIDGVADGSTITCSAGDTVTVRALTTTIFKLTRTKSDGTASNGGGAMDHLGTVIASDHPTVDITDIFDSTYDEYEIRACGVTHATVGTLRAILQINGNYVTTNYNYITERASQGDAAPVTSSHANNDSIELNATVTNTFPARFTCIISNPTDTTKHKSAEIIGSSMDGSSSRIFHSNGVYYGDTLPLTGIRFYMVSGNIATGIFHVYGIKKA